MEPWLIELIVFLPAILFVGVKTSIEDFKYSRIRNKYIIFSVIYAILAYFLLILSYKILGFNLRISYIFEVAINSAVALAAGFLLWNFRLWSAADAKLFFAYSLIMPLSIYRNIYIKNFPSITLLINTFLPFLLYSWYKITFFTSMKTKIELTKKIKPSLIFGMILFLFWIQWALNILMGFLNIKLDPFSMFVLIYAAISLLYKVLGNSMLYISFIISLIRLVLDKSVLNLSFLTQFLIFSLLLLIVFAVLSFSMEIFTREVKVKGLRSGMILSDIIYRKKGEKKYKKESSAFIDPSFAKGKEFLKLEQPAEGLTEKDVRGIKKMYKKRILSFSSLKVQQTLPFAPFIFGGCILTILSQGNLMIFVKNLLERFIKIS